VGPNVVTLVPETNDLKNVAVRFGIVFGRGGMSNYHNASPSSTSPIIGLLNYDRASAASNDLLRLTPSKLEKLNLATGAWSNVTGDPLNGTSLTRPQYTLQNDILVYTMEGLSRPQGYGTNSAVAVNFTQGTTLGGTPPYAKTLTSYMQFLMLGNISADGSFTDVVDGWRTIEYSDDPFFSWTNCLGNTIDLYQTPGPLLAMRPLGRVCMCYKSDGVIRLTWVGTAVRFTQELIPGSVGIAAPLSLGDLGTFGHAYLGTDGVIYQVTQNAVQPVSSEKLFYTLPPTLALNRNRYARALVIPSQDLYVLFYDRTGLGGQFLDSYVTWNYRTGEFGKGELGQQVIAAQLFKEQDDGPELALVSGNNKVWHWDSTTNRQDDDGVKVERYWTSGWQQLGGNEGWLYGVIVDMRKSAKGRIKVEVARNFSTRFEFSQEYSLRGIDPDPARDRVELHYRLPSPMFGQWFNVKVTFYHDRATNAVTEMFGIGFIGREVHKYPVSQQLSPDATETRGS
jgi:hypothetical protein